MLPRFSPTDPSTPGNAMQDDKVRVFILEAPAWKTQWVPSSHLLVPALHFSVLEFFALENERLIPQQAVSTLTNVDDIEAHIRTREITKGTQYLFAIDLPKSDRQRVMRDLGSMGITAGSLFPGLDGDCEELKERFFEL